MTVKNNNFQLIDDVLISQKKKKDDVGLGKENVFHSIHHNVGLSKENVKRKKNEKKSVEKISLGTGRAIRAENFLKSCALIKTYEFSAVHSIIR
jgi:hypothetical protein